MNYFMNNIYQDFDTERNPLEDKLPAIRLNKTNENIQSDKKLTKSRREYYFLIIIVITQHLE